MRMRVTTGMAMNTYRYNLQNSTSNLTNSRNTVLSQRKFNSFAENPSAATQAWRVRRAQINTASYLKNNTDTYTRFNIAWASLGTASRDLTDLGGRSADIYAASDPTAAGRPALGRVLQQTAESVVQTLNGAKSGENFLFAGDDELYAPFTWENNQLYYRGVNVNAGSVKSPAEAPSWAPKDANGQAADYTDTAALAEAFRKSVVPSSSSNESEQEWIKYYKDTAGTVAQPTTPVPSWAQDADGNAVAKTDDAMAAAFLDSLPEQGADAAEDAWIAYYKQDPAGALKPTVNPEEIWKQANGTDDYGTVKGVSSVAEDPAASAFDRAWAAYLSDQGDVRKLDAMSKEQATIDLGMGLLQDENGKLIDGTYFDRSLPGINMLGYGVDENGDPNNVCMIMVRLGQIYSNCNPDTGSYDYDDPDGKSEKAKTLRAEAMRLLDKLKAGQSNVSGQYVEISAKASFLEQNEDRLTLQRDYLDEQRAELEDVDLAQAISQFSWDYYCYSAALKVGTQLLSQSLIDYMS